VESANVASYIKTSNQNWLAKPKKDGGLKKISSMRAFSDKAGKYLGAWDRLGFEEMKKS
jgi:hypothetical protein